MPAPPPPVVSLRINAERLVLLGWSRAILLQIAHPLVAAGVAAHSSFRGGSIAAARRLHHTVRAMLDISFGDPERQTRALTGIRAIHDRVHGTLGTRVGLFAEGTPYSANEPELLLWVHVTLIESIVLAHDTFIRPLDAAERDAYCEEATWVPIELGARAGDVPHTWAALTTVVTRYLQSGSIVVGPDAKPIGEVILWPPMRPVIWPAAWLNRAFTASTLPPGIRAAYGLEWSAARQARLTRAASAVRTVRRVLPAPVAMWRGGRLAVARPPATSRDGQKTVRESR